jgi:hypothetical protein
MMGQGDSPITVGELYDKVKGLHKSDDKSL